MYTGCQKGFYLLLCMFSIYIRTNSYILEQIHSDKCGHINIPSFSNTQRSEQCLPNNNLTVTLFMTYFLYISIVSYGYISILVIVHINAIIKETSRSFFFIYLNIYYRVIVELYSYINKYGFLLTIEQEVLRRERFKFNKNNYFLPHPIPFYH